MSIRPRFKKTVFENGLTLVTERHSGFRSLSIGVWVKGGTRHELPREAGASHFLEHMLFKGTDTRTALDIAREVDQVGGEFNAFTTRDHTCFYILMLARDSALGVDILSDIVLNSDFDPEEYERERKVILQEISMVEEAPEELIHDLYFELAYGKHPLGKPILGTDSSIRRMRRADLLRFFRQHYRPDQLIISVAGDIEHQSLKRRLKPLLKARWPGREKAAKTPRIVSAELPRLRQGTWWVKRPSEQIHLVWGVPAPTYASPDRITAYLLNNYLGEGMSSALFQEIREKNGLAYTVYSNFSPFYDSGVLSIYAGTTMKQLPLCMKLIEECVDRVKKRLLTEDELHRAKENIKGSILLSSDSVEARMSSVAKNEMFLGRYFSVEEICRLYERISAEDIRRVARKYLRLDRRSLLFLGPNPSRDVRKKLRPKVLER